MSGGPRCLFFDYVGPLSWVLDREVAALEREGSRSGARPPFEVRPPPAELVDPDDRTWTGRWDEAVRLAADRGVAVGPRPSLVPWTRKAHELALHAREKGGFYALHEALYRAFVVEGLDIGRVDVLVGLAAAVGLDPSEARAVLGVDRHTEAPLRSREEAERAGVRGVPTLLVGGARVEGVPGREALRALLMNQ